MARPRKHTDDTRQLIIRVDPDTHAWINWLSTKSKVPIQDILTDVIRQKYHATREAYPNTPAVPSLEAPPEA